MKVCFRTDASLDIGIGHVMRCLTLADALRERGAECRFICREHPGHRIDLIQRRGYLVHALPIGREGSVGMDAPKAAHATWLGCGWREDADQTKLVVAELKADWLVVDHYSLDARWERELRTNVRRIMVIDDLADRPHDADLLLDQNLGRADHDYAALVPATCRLLIGPEYSLLRPEFAELREYSLARRCPPKLSHLMVSMGGVDANNATGHVLKALQLAALPPDCRVTVVMGMGAPWLDSVREQAKGSRWPCEVLVDVEGMAQLMADSDIAIGAAGGTSWERCSLGLPCLVIVLAANQREIAAALSQANAVVDVGLIGDHTFDERLVAQLDHLSSSPEAVRRLSNHASKVTRGDGVAAVSKEMRSIYS